jgi:hypothetical protein
VLSVGVTTSHKLQPAAMLCHEHDSDENFPEKFKQENFLEKYCGKFSVRENFLWKIVHLTSLATSQKAVIFAPRRLCYNQSR